MNEQQKQRALQILRRFEQADPMTRQVDNAAVDMAALLQELIDADTRFRSLVSAAIHGADTDARSVVVDGKSVFFSRDGDGITDTHTLSPCPHCRGSGAAEDCEQPAIVPDWLETTRFLTDVTTAAGLLGHGRRDKGLARRIGDFAHKYRMLAAAPAAQEPDQSEQHLEMVNPPAPSVPDGDLSEARRIVEQQRGEIERLRQEVAMLRQEYAADTAEIERLESRLADVEAINSIDARFCARLALILECAILDPHGNFELACQLLEEYKAEWEKVNPSPPTFMGEPMPPERRARLLEMRAKRNEQEQSE